MRIHKQVRFCVTWREDGDLCIDYQPTKVQAMTQFRWIKNLVRIGEKITEITAPKQCR